MLSLSTQFAIMASRKPTILDIARKMNVTPSTVSRALSGSGRISRQTVEEVHRVAKELNYQRNQVASALRQGNTKMIGVMLPRIDRYYFASVVRNIEQVAQEHGYTVMMMQSNEDRELERVNLDAMLRAQVSGIIASVGLYTDDHAIYAEVNHRGVPLVLFDRILKKVTASRVTTDDYRGGFLATEHLIQQGCRKLIHLAGVQNLYIYQERQRGFVDALRANGLPFDENINILKTSNQTEEGKVNVATRIRQGPTFDGIFSASDWGAVGAMIACRAAGLSVPGDVAVAGFSNEPFTEYLTPNLTTIDQQSAEIGIRAARESLRLIEQDDDSRTQDIVLEPRLIVRASSLRT